MIAANDPGIAIEVHGVSLHFVMQKGPQFTLKELLAGWLLPKRLHKMKKHVLRDVSFSVSFGDCVGLIGPNGAGKTTLLRTITGAYPPEKGKVVLHGHASSVMSLQSIFVEPLSGVENVRLLGAMMGLERARVDRLLEDVLRFSGLEESIEYPVETYSSGMKARLHFSIMTAVEPDILLIDELLAVGDASFRAKSQERVIELIRGRRAAVIATHSLGFVKRWCNKALWLDEGRIVSYGSSADVLRGYEARYDLGSKAAGIAAEPADNPAAPAT